MAAMIAREHIQAVNLVLAILFVVGAGLQLNDPDPWAWVGIYLAAAAACLLWGRFSRAWLLAAAVAAGSLAWAALIAADVPTWVSPARLVEPMETMGGAVEMEREIGGLGILALWMLVLCALSWRERRR